MKKANSRATTSKRSTLMLIAVLLIGSAGIRVSGYSHVFTAVAAESEENEPKPEMEMTETKEDEGSPSRKIVEILADVQEREKRLREKEALIQERMAILTLAKSEFEENMIALEKAEKKLRETMALASTAAEDDLSRLTSVYENMKPKEAAILFEEMEPEFAAGFLARMRPDSAAAVMAGLESKTAYDRIGRDSDHLRNGVWGVHRRRRQDGDYPKIPAIRDGNDWWRCCRGFYDFQ